MVFESEFLQYGAMGLLAAVLFYLLIRQQKKDDERDTKMSQVIENNTIALTQVRETTSRCRYNQRG